VLRSIQPDYYFKSYLLVEIESWESLNLHAVGDALVLGGVNLGDRAGRVLVGEHFGGTLVLGGKLLAVTAGTEIQCQTLSLTPERAKKGVDAMGTLAPVCLRSERSTYHHGA
jgi:hypothetical protein